MDTPARMYFTRSKLHDFKAAGVLPITIYSGQPYVLLGAESCRTGPEGRVCKVMWRDFGGQREAIDNDAAETAAREFAEETLGLFGGCDVNPRAVLRSARQMAAQLQGSSSGFFRVVHQLKKGEYHMFICSTPFIEPVMFHLALQQNLQSRAIAGAEKTDFAWVRLPELMEAVGRCSRQYHFSSRQRLCSRTQHQPAAGSSHRLQLHPCFASSLRLARAAGLDAFVANLLSDAPQPPTPHLQPPQQPPPSTTPTPPAAAASISPPTIEPISAAPACSTSTTPLSEAATVLVAAASLEPLVVTTPAATLAKRATYRQGQAASEAHRGLTPDHMLYWLMQSEVALQLAGPSSSGSADRQQNSTAGAAEQGEGGPAVEQARGGASGSRGLAQEGGSVVGRSEVAGGLPRRRRKRRKHGSMVLAPTAAAAAEEAPG